MRAVWIIFKKELIDNLRDRRSVSSALVTPVLMPLMIVSLLIVMGRTLLADPQEKPLQLPVIGAEYAPALIAYFQQNNVEIIPAPVDPETAVKNGDVDVVLVISEDYAAKLAEGLPAPVQVVVDTSRQSALNSTERTYSLLQQYSSTVGVLRLQARGVNPVILSALSIERVDMATPESQALIFLNMMPFLLIMTIFVGGMYVVIDTTAGERERGSLEPLLINPVPRWQVAVGKLAASLPFSVATLGLTLVLFLAAFNLLPLSEIVGFPLSLDGRAIWNIFILCLPIVLLASGLQMLVATFTRSFKEAQTYLSLLPLIAGMPGAFLAFLSVKPGLVNMLIPAFSQSILINQILRGEMVIANNVMISSAATLVFSLILIGVSIRLYSDERIVFGGTGG